MVTITRALLCGFCVLGSACEQRFELILAPDAAVEVDAGAGADAGTDAGCTPLDLDLGSKLTRVSLLLGAEGPIVFGLSADTLSALRFVDGGLVTTPLATQVTDTMVDATRGRDSLAVAFHAPEPTLLRVGEDGAPLGAPVSVMRPGAGPNGSWGIRVTPTAGGFVIVYRTLGALAAFTTWSNGALQYVVGDGAVGAIDGAGEGDEVLLATTSGPGLELERRSFDGGVRSTRVLANEQPSGRPFVCPALTVFPVGDGGLEAVGTSAFGAGAGVSVRGQCEPGGATTASLVAGRDQVLVRRVRAGGAVEALLSLPVPTLDDYAVQVDGQSAWLVLAPRFRPTAQLLRRCLP